MTFSPELELAIEALRVGLGAIGKGTTHGADLATINEAMTICVANKTLLMAQKHLAGVCSPQQKFQLEKYKLQTFIINTTIIRETVNITNLLRNLNCKFLIFKGPLQQKIVYSDLNNRPVADIDILVDRNEYKKHRDNFLSHGFEEVGSSVWWHAFLGEVHLVNAGPPEITVDLHYRIQQPGSPAPRSAATYLATAETVQVLGVDVPFLATQDIPILSAISIVKGLFNRECVGAHVCDLYARVGAATPQTLNQLLTRADEQDLRGTVLLALRIVAHTFNVDFDQRAGIDTILSAISGPELVRMAFTPDDPTVVWPKRRQVLWELCLRQPTRYAKEAVRALASEATRRMFERSAPDPH